MQMHRWCYLQTFSSMQSGSTTVPLGHPQSQSPGAAGKGWWGERCSAPTGKLSSNRNLPHFGQIAGLRRSRLPVLWTGQASPEHRNTTIITVPCLKLEQFVMTNGESRFQRTIVFFFLLLLLHNKFDPDCLSLPFCYHKKNITMCVKLMVFDLYNTNDGCSRNCFLCWYHFLNLNYAFEYSDWRKNKENKDCGCMSRGKAQPGSSIPSKNKKSEFTSKYICICAKSVYVLDSISHWFFHQCMQNRMNSDNYSCSCRGRCSVFIRVSLTWAVSLIAPYRLQ